MEEKQIPLIRYINEKSNEIIAFTQDLIRTNSENPPGNEAHVAQVIIAKLKDLGLNNIEIFESGDGRHNVICRIQGNDPQGLKTIFGAHMDTKPTGDITKWRFPPFDAQIIEDKLYGLGSSDMKGAIAAMVYAFGAIHHIYSDLAGTLELVLSADEEAGSRFGAEFLVKQNRIAADYVILGEPSGVEKDWESLCVVSRGVCCFNVKVYGSQMHSSLSDRTGAINASIKMANVLSKFKDVLKLTYEPHPYCPDGPTVNPGVMVQGGVFYGVNPGYAEFSCDIRTIPGMTKEQLALDIQECLNFLMADDPELQVEFEFAQPPLDWIEPTEISDQSPAVIALQRASESVLGYAPPLRAFPGGTDASFFQGKAGIPTIPSFGPGLLTVAHSPLEYISVESIIQATKIYALTGLDLLHRHKI